MNVHLRSLTHTLSLTLQGAHSVRWMSRGRERKWTEHAGAVTFLGRDGEVHDFVTQAVSDCTSLVLFIPWRHLDQIAHAEGIEAAAEPMRMVASYDPIMQSCLRTFGRPTSSLDDHEDHGREETARRIILRLLELGGHGMPDWHDDASVFDGRTLRRLVDHVDANLRIAPGLDDMGIRVGLSPSHFAKKFRQSTGLSFHRFVNRRRIGAAFDMLKDQSRPLAEVALELGFSSQSHFTRLFSDLTGMTPAKYRRQTRPTVG